MTTPRTICQEAHELLLANQESYGDPVNSWRRIAEAVSRRTGTYVSADVALWVLVERELERHGHRAQDPKHLRGAAGYLAILAQLQAAERAEVDERIRRGGIGRTP